MVIIEIPTVVSSRSMALSSTSISFASSEFLERFVISQGALS